MGSARRIMAGLLTVAVLAMVTLACGPEAEDDARRCERSTPADRSVARLWNEAMLAAIRSDFPSPTVHARNLFHTSAAMWDSWAAYDPAATGVFVDESLVIEGGDRGGALTAAREEAMSYAAYRILVERYLPSPGAEEAVTRLDDLMVALCFDAAVTTIDGDAPAALGNRIAAEVLARGLDDGSNEAQGYADPGYAPANPPLIVDQPGTAMDDPNRWQPLELETMVAQNGLPLDETVQTFVGPHWGLVTSFALPPADADGLTIDPGPPPRLGDPATDRQLKIEINEVIRHGAVLDPSAPATIDLSPGALGRTPPVGYEPAGHEVNPTTGEPYRSEVVPLGDYGRTVAEFWADGPESETPPGHWNALANEVGDRLAAAGPLRVGGGGEAVDRLEWDLKLYLALNGAVHDAAIAAWGVKGHYDSARPISLIRHMGGLGQSSDPDGPSYHPDGLMLESGLVEVVTEESSAPGGRHTGLGDHVGEVAVRGWPGAPDDPASTAAGAGWIRAVEWVPYQMPTFVTPSFAGYVSGHSAFSRAAAVVLTEMTGDPFFPDGIGRWPVAANSLTFELGPSQEVVLQWATYEDAAVEAGRSRLYGGIHIRADDQQGRWLGEQVGRAAWERAGRHYDGVGS